MAQACPEFSSSSSSPTGGKHILPAAHRPLLLRVLYNSRLDYAILCLCIDMQGIHLFFLEILPPEPDVNHLNLPEKKEPLVRVFPILSQK